MKPYFVKKPTHFSAKEYEDSVVVSSQKPRLMGHF